MATDLSTLVQQIKAVQQAIQGDESNIVLRMVELGELLIRLRRKGGGDWGRHASELGYPPRIATRYMLLGKSWWANNRLRESGLTKELPTDLLKLEWLCRLTHEQLVEGLNNWRCREWSRSQLIDAVKLKLDFKAKVKPVQAVTIDRIREECDKFVERVLEAIETSPEEMADPTARQRLLDELQSKFAEVERVLDSSEEVGEQPAEDDAEDATSTDAGGAEEAPVEQVSA